VRGQHAVLPGSFLPGGSFGSPAWADRGFVAVVTLTAVGIVVLAGGLQGWFFRGTSAVERLMLIVAGLMLVYPRRAV